MKRYLFVLLVVVTLLSGCNINDSEYKDGGFSGGAVGSTERNCSDSHRSPEVTYDGKTWIPIRPGAEELISEAEASLLLSGEATLSAEQLLKRAMVIPHHPLNPSTQLPDKATTQLVETLWVDYTQDKVSAEKALYQAFRVVVALRRPISCRDLTEDNITPEEASEKWHQAAVQWLQQQLASGALNEDDFKYYYKCLTGNEPIL